MYHKTHSLLALLLIILILALPAIAQESIPAESAVFTIPPMLLFLIGINNRGTEAVKLWLTAPSLPFTPAESVRRVLVLASSLVIGLLSAISIPDALSWLPENVQNSLFLGFPVAAVFIVAVASSFGGAAAQYVLMVLSGAGKWLNAPK